MFCLKRYVEFQKERSSLDLQSLELVTLGECTFEFTHIAIYESMKSINHLSNYLLDLPKLHTISYTGNWALLGDWRMDCKMSIHGHESYANTFIMKSSFCMIAKGDRLL